MSILKALSFLFEQGVQAKNALYEKGYIESQSLSVPVISVGNISVGGTGKTSFVIWLLRSLTEHGLKVGVISRGYGGKISAYAQVPVGGDPEKYGDEPCLIANEKLGPVYVGPRRAEVGHELLKSHKVDLLIADDAFQHRRLRRDVDIVLIDFSEPQKNYEMMPYGRLRESFESLHRASVIVATKKSFSETKDFSSIESRIPKDKIRLEMDYGLEGFFDAHGNVQSELRGSGLLVSGVAKPGTVEGLVRSQVSLRDHFIFRDHHNYTSGDVASILRKAREINAEFILTTEKDAVKLMNFNELAGQLRVLKLAYVVKGQINEFFEMVIGKAR